MRATGVRASAATTGSSPPPRRQAPSVAASAGPIVSSSIAARKPPCTWPAGLVKAVPASNVVSIVPASASMCVKRMFSVAAAPGGGSWPSITCQKYAFLSIARSPLLILPSMMSGLGCFAFGYFPRRKWGGAHTAAMNECGCTTTRVSGPA